MLLGTGYNYMIRLNINIAIVAMVKNYGTSKTDRTSSECFEASQNITNFTANGSNSLYVTSSQVCVQLYISCNYTLFKYILCAGY